MTRRAAALPRSNSLLLRHDGVAGVTGQLLTGVENAEAVHQEPASSDAPATADAVRLRRPATAASRAPPPVRALAARRYRPAAPSCSGSPSSPIEDSIRRLTARSVTAPATAIRRATSASSVGDSSMAAPPAAAAALAANTTGRSCRIPFQVGVAVSVTRTVV